VKLALGVGGGERCDMVRTIEIPESANGEGRKSQGGDSNEATETGTNNGKGLQD
jgi:hypothetical protein